MFDIWMPWGKKQVAQSEYDVAYKWYEEKRDEVDAIRQVLAPFASTGTTTPGGEVDSTIRLALNARDLLHASSVTIKQQARENEQLLDQLDDVNGRLRKRDDFINKLAEQKQIDTVLHLAMEDELEKANHLIEVLQAQVDTLKAKRSTHKEAGE
jgi:hypothetical protein